MRTGILHSLDDLNWLRETCLRGVPLPIKYLGFKCAAIQGNEDSPQALYLYVEHPTRFMSDYLWVRFDVEPPAYCEYIEMCGRTAQPMWQRVQREPLAYASEGKPCR